MKDLDLKTINRDLKQYHTRCTIKKILITVLAMIIVIKLLHKYIKRNK